MVVEAGERPPLAVRLARVALLVAAVLAVPLLIISIVARRHLDAADDAYLQAMAALGVDEADAPAEVRARLNYDMLTAGVVLLTTGWLARSLSSRQRWAQVGVWLVAVAGWASLGCGLAVAPELVTWGSGLDEQVDHLLEDLLVSWYPVTHSTLVAGVLVALAMATVLLLRTEAQEFYRKVNRADVVDWADFTHDRTDERRPDR